MLKRPRGMSCHGHDVVLNTTGHPHHEQRELDFHPSWIAVTHHAGSVRRAALAKFGRPPTSPGSASNDATDHHRTLTTTGPRSRIGTRDVCDGRQDLDPALALHAGTCGSVVHGPVCR